MKQDSILYRKPQVRSKKNDTTVFQILFSVLLFALGLYLVFAFQTTNNTFPIIAVFGGITIIIGIYILNFNLQFLSKHRPQTRWDHTMGRYDASDVKNAKYQFQRCNPYPRRFIGDDGIISPHPNIFAIDLMQSLWLVVSVLLFSWLSALTHRYKPQYYVSISFLTSQFIWYLVLFYFTFRSLMILTRMHFIGNVLLTSLIICTLLTTVQAQTFQLFWFWFGLNYVFISSSTLIVSSLFCRKILYEF